MHRRSACILLCLLLLLDAGTAIAKGVVRVQQSNGSVKNYDVSIRVVHRSLRIMTSDGKGTLIIDHAACSYVGELQRCLLYGAKLQQNGETRPIDIDTGTVYVNLTNTKQQLPFSSTQIDPQGILLTMRTKIGTYVSMHGRIDEWVR